MESAVVQILGVTVGTLVSIFTMLIKIRKEIVRHQKEVVESRVAEEKRIIALENRIELVEQETLYNISMLNQRLAELNQRFDLFLDLILKQTNG